MLEYNVNKVYKTYTEKYYITYIAIDIRSADCCVRVKSSYTNIVKKTKVKEGTSVLIELYTHHDISSVQLEIIDPCYNKKNIKINVPCKVDKKIKTFIKKNILKRGDNIGKNMFSSEYENVFYSIDYMLGLPKYNLIKVSGWLFSKNGKIQIDSENNTKLWGYISYKRDDISAIYNTNDKTGFEAIVEVENNAEFSVVSGDVEIFFSFNKRDINYILEEEEQLEKKEEFCNSAPYIIKEIYDRSHIVNHQGIDVLVACNNRTWLNNILTQADKHKDVNFIIAANSYYKEEISGLIANHSNCNAVFDEKTSKEDLRYKSLRNVKNEWCCFCDQEDDIDEMYFAYMIEMAKRKTKIVCSDYDLKDNYKSIVRIIRDYNSWTKENPNLKMLGCLIRTDYIKDSVNYDEVLQKVSLAKKYDVEFLRGDYIGYHYNCVVNTWDNIEKVNNIAFYLTQYHENEENNEWWGKGFTEWTNVKKGTPMLEEHHQPRIPGELGYYDLVEEKDIFHKQISMAKEYGINGFCFYYYWFNGKRLLRKPLDIFLQDSNEDFNYCICWANESWTRRWDGLEQEILMEQVHDDSTDIGFIHDVLPLLKDKRYIKVDGKPLLLIYRMELFPNPEKTIETWRRICRDEKVGEIHISIVQSFNQINPIIYGADSATEFPPHKVNKAGNVCVNEDKKVIHSDFKGNIYSYEKTVKNLTNVVRRDYSLMQGSMLEWDNTARRSYNSNIFCDFSLDLFRLWCIKNVFYTRLYNYNRANCVFYNAWNEWAEGSYLEPDEKYGKKKLEIIKEVNNLK